eukprot:1505800-Amphidinium_carterae.1
MSLPGGSKQMLKVPHEAICSLRHCTHNRVKRGRPRPRRSQSPTKSRTESAFGRAFSMFSMIRRRFSSLRREG